MKEFFPDDPRVRRFVDNNWQSPLKKKEPDLLAITKVLRSHYYFATWVSRNQRVKLVTRVPGARVRSILATLFTKKVFERVFAEPISDMQVEYMDALSKGSTRHANWIVARGHMIILSTLAYYVFSSTIGKLIRDLLKPTKISD